jgi:hypothetical protein
MASSKLGPAIVSHPIRHDHIGFVTRRVREAKPDDGRFHTRVMEKLPHRLSVQQRTRGTDELDQTSRAHVRARDEYRVQLK